MTIELIDIALAERQAHPRLPDRFTGKVRAVLAETIGDQQFRHEITLPVWVDSKPGMSDEDIDLGLMVKAADIIGRLKHSLGRPAA
jgi:hypothetical protein